MLPATKSSCRDTLQAGRVFWKKRSGLWIVSWRRTTMDSRLRSLPIPFKSFQSSLLGGSAALFGGLMLGNLVAYLYQMLMARMMSPAEYGVLVTLTSISYVLTILMRTFQAWVIKAIAATQIAGTSQIRPIFTGAMRTLVPLGAIA